MIASPRKRTAPSPRRSLASMEPRVLLIGQLVAIGAILALSSVSQAMLTLDAFDRRPIRGILYLFYVDGEWRLPAFYSSVILLICAGVLAATAKAAFARGTAEGRAWAALSGIFVVLAIDELMAFHERSIHPLRAALDIDAGPLYYTWVLPGVLVVVGLGVAFVPFLVRLPADTRRAIMAGGSLFVAGALGVEAIGGALEGAAGVDGTPRTVAYVALVTVEEGLEMVGIALFLTAVVRHRRLRL